MTIGCVREFLDCLRAGKFTSIGSYPLFFVCADGQTLSVEHCLAHVCRLARTVRDCSSDRPVSWLVNWEDPHLYCDGSGGRIESAYAENERASLAYAQNLSE